jgi:tripeptidyl-peptidase I
MKLTVLLTWGVGVACAVPDTHIVHEKRDLRSSRWAKRSRIAGDALLPVRIGLTQTNIDKTHQYLMEISDPKSDHFGQLWTPEEVIEAFKPTDETVNAITQWLASEG